MPTNITGRNARILEARRLFQRAMDGDLRARAELQETLTTSDFPILLNAAYGRELQTEYAAWPTVWNRFSSRVTVPDFRSRTLVDLMGGKAGLDKVKEAAEFPARSKTESSKNFKVEKYGARFPLTWEMLVNDDLGAFRTFATDLATAARETEERVAVKPLFNAAGTALNTNFFTGVAAPDTPTLTRESLRAALRNIARRKDVDGRPIVMPNPVLLIPTALEDTALDILSTTQIRTTSGSDETILTGNGLPLNPEVVVNPWLEVVAPNYANIDTMWALLPNPSNTNKRALVTGFLNGYETPDLRVKADAGNRVGGGAISPEEGAFDDDTIQYRVRHVTGGAALYNDAVYLSTGTVAPA